MILVWSAIAVLAVANVFTYAVTMFLCSEMDRLNREIEHKLND